MNACLKMGLFVFGLQGSALAQEVSISGGSTECARWIESRGANDSAVLEHFVIGCLNGLSLGTGKEFWQANAMPISREAVYAAMDQYCRNNPGGLIVAGSIQLFRDRTRPLQLNFK